MLGPHLECAFGSGEGPPRAAGILPLSLELLDRSTLLLDPSVGERHVAFGVFQQLMQGVAIGIARPRAFAGLLRLERLP